MVKPPPAVSSAFHANFHARRFVDELRNHHVAVAFLFPLAVFGDDHFRVELASKKRRQIFRRQRPTFGIA